MLKKRLKASCVIIALACSSCAGMDGNLMAGSGALLGGLGGAGIGAALGGKNPLVATLIGAGLGGILGQIVQNLSAPEQQQRQAALQEAAQGPTGTSSAWSTPQTAENAPSAGKPAKVKHAKYVNRGFAKNNKGQTCSKVLETITLPDGKSGTSEELVCPILA